MKAPKTITHVGKERQIADRNRKIFSYASSKADIRYFKIGIADWLKFNRANKSFTECLFTMVHKRNNDGKTLKYCYFNDHQQRVFLDRNFEAWANETREEIYRLLKKINA